MLPSCQRVQDEMTLLALHPFPASVIPPACVLGIQSQRLSLCADWEGEIFIFLSWSQVQVQAGERLACHRRRFRRRSGTSPPLEWGQVVGQLGEMRNRDFYQPGTRSTDFLYKTQSEEKYISNMTCKCKSCFQGHSSSPSLWEPREAALRCPA